MKTILISFMVICFSTTFAQFNVVSTSIEDGTTNTPLDAVFSVEFSSALDTSNGFRTFENFFTNIPEPSLVWYSSGGTTLNFQLDLAAAADYFILIFFAESEAGVPLAQPAIIHFTTAASFSGSNVSGSVLAGATGASLNNALVILSSIPLSQGEPQIEAAAFTNALGNFTIKNVLNGTYYPLAAQDINGDGSIDPDQGDALAIGDELIVDGPISGLVLTLTIPDPISFAEAKVISDSLKTEWLNADAVLKGIWSYNTDSTGIAGSWRFTYLSVGEENATDIRIDRFSNSQENLSPFDYVHYFQTYTISNIEDAADIGVFLANTEAAGGADFRNQQYPAEWEYELSVYLGDVRSTQFNYLVPASTTDLYWGADYRMYSRQDTNWYSEAELLFVADFETGELILTDSKENENLLPSKFELLQNYPNPFNPTTKIEFALPHLTKVNLTVFDLIGNEVATLVNGVIKAGGHSVEFNAHDFTSGVYFYRIIAGDFVQTKKLILIK